VGNIVDICTSERALLKTQSGHSHGRAEVISTLRSPFLGRLTYQQISPGYDQPAEISRTLGPRKGRARA
jgi:hypothetical protein